MTWTEDYYIWLFLDDGYTTLSPGGLQVYGDEGGFPRCAYLEVKCGKCGATNLLYADVDENLSVDERAMGPEVLHGLTFNQRCGGCKTDLEASVDIWEYPVLSLSINEMNIQSDLQHAEVHGLDGFAAEVARSTKPPRDLVEQLEVGRQALEQMFHRDELPEDIIELMEKFMERRKRFVVVLGNYKTSGVQLEAIKAHLGQKGYSANLVKELPDFEDKSIAQKSFIMMSQAAFCVMLDDVASGHVLEYGHASQNEVILARITPPGGGSTWMIGEQGRPTGHHVKEFRLTKALEAVLDDAITWAEQTKAERAQAFSKSYPWMKDANEDD